MVCVVIIVPPPPHLRRRHRTLNTWHRLQHSFQRITVQTHTIFPVHVLRTLGLAPPIADIIVEHVVVVSVAHHVHIGVVDGFGVGEDVMFSEGWAS